MRRPMAILLTIGGGACLFTGLGLAAVNPLGAGVAFAAGLVILGCVYQP